MATEPELKINQTLVRLELISTLFRQVPRSLLAHFLASSVMFALLWHDLPKTLAVTWLLLLYIAVQVAMSPACGFSAG